MPMKAKIIRFRKNKLQLFIVSICSLLLNSCVEPFEPTVDYFEDILVIDALITNQNKQHEITLSRSFRFEEKEAKPEINAAVKITDSNGNTYIFNETNEGKYVSEQSFAAIPNLEYQLLITTENGRAYTSSKMKVPVASTIQNLHAERTTNSDGIEGMDILLDSYDPNGESRLYRYEYEETWKIIAPYWTPYDAVVQIEGQDTFTLNVILREQEERVCYGTVFSKNIISKSTLGLSEDRINNFTVRFIERDNYILTYRYSILVKQFVVSPETFSYYDVLKKLSQSETNAFSENQPGFLPSNIFSVDDPNENIAGYFEVSSVDEKRIFFNYEDFFNGEEPPPYYEACSITAPSTNGALGKRPLLNFLYDNALRYYGPNFTQEFGTGPFEMVSPYCGDCTTLGSNIVPDFWTE